MGRLIQRRVQGIARQRITESPVVLLQGPRSVGKSTLLRALAEEHGGRVVDFDEPAVRAAAADDPGLFVVGRRPVFIDEYQHVPEVLDSIKAELNRDGSPGQFVITGSTRFDSLPLAAQSLTGRLHRIEIHPLSQGEIGDSRENLLESLFADASTVATPQASATTRA
ncbi:MAG: AAA family ATPase, partial [Acidimicrobiaceae bacterium]|nr:AAA family ATPase [Acidimicrobiaceae bacterium]